MKNLRILIGWEEFLISTDVWVEQPYSFLQVNWILISEPFRKLPLSTVYKEHEKVEYFNEIQYM